MQSKKYILTMLLFILIATSIIVINIDHSASTYTPKYEYGSAHQLPNIGVSTITGTSPPSSGDWNISDTTIIENEILIINGSIFIENGGTLILKNSIIYMNLNSDGEYWIEVLSGGNLTIIGSNITAYNPDNNYYIKVDNGAKFYMERSEISYAGYTWGTNGDKTGLWINTDDIIIKNSSIHNNYYGMFIYYGSNVTVSNCLIYNNSWSGIYIRGSNVVVSSCSIFENSHGAYIYFGSNVEFSNCLIYNNIWGGIYINHGSNVAFFNCLIHNNTYGMYIGYGSNVVVFNCSIFENDDYGVYIYLGSNVVFSNCLIRSNNNYGIYIDDSNNVTAIFNNILNNTIAFYVDSSSYAVLMYLNNFIGNIQLPYDYGSNRFDNDTYGNYWSNYQGYDENYDLIGDITYQIDSNSIDRYPLISPMEFIGTNLAVIRNYVQTGENEVYIYAKVMSIGKSIDDVVLTYYENGIPLVTTMNYNAIIGTYYAKIKINENSTYYHVLVKSASEWYSTSKKQLLLNDLEHPSITNVLWIPFRPAVGENVTVMCDVSDNGNIAQVILSYYDTQWRNVTMQHNNSINAYQATIVSINSSVLFKIYAQDNSGNWAVTELYNIEPEESKGTTSEQTSDQPPSITNVLWVPSTPVVSENITIYVWVLDDYGISTVILSYYKSDWHNITMEYNSSLGAYIAVISDLSVNDTLFFRVYVFDTAGQCAISKVYRISIGTVASEVSSREGTFFGMTAENVIIMMIFVSIISLFAGLGIGLRRRK